MSPSSITSRLPTSAVQGVPLLEMGFLLVLPDNLAKGAGRGKAYTTLRFQYNPETITRVRAGEWTTDRGKTGRQGLPAQDKTLRDGHRGGGLLAKSETVSFKLLFDATDLRLQGDAAANVLPELAFLEQIALGGEEPMKTETTTGGTAIPPKPGQNATAVAGAQGGSGKAPAGQAPANQTAAKSPVKTTIQSTAPSELLLVLQKRAFPVVLISLTIVEQRFNPSLEPIRAECDCKFRVLETQEVKNNKPAQVAFTELLNQRRAGAARAAAADNDPRVQSIIQALEGGSGS
jgi:hypothetical protein